ncbi:sensor histidine kinase [Micromonospora sp. RTP1Z1]|uniref:sensor histidine kinase n=1 Tax=Micromonospora sp. RTP1Z1 TaxID=2994043 RepID=UPI0029C78129|nr:histidine kinase [Micromonospora sp. RTP1Z1]
MPEPFWRADRGVDLLVAAAVGALAVATTWGEAQTGTPLPRVVLIAVAGLSTTALLLVRRRIPLAVVLGTAGCAALVTVTAEHPAAGPIAPAVALYTLAVRSGWRRIAVAGTVTLGLLAAAAAVRSGSPGGPVAQAFFVLGAAAVTGLYVGSRTQVARALRARAVQLEREQTLLAREAVLAERIWIARELHDSIGHHVSLLVVQAGAVRSTLPEDHLTRPVLDSMIAGGKEAMTEMRRMVDVLRPVADDSTADQFGPPPALDETPILCEQLRQTGLPVDLELFPGTGVPRTASVAAYRIIQEALTNVVKHAGLVPTQVRVTRSGDVLDIRVTNAAGQPGRPPLHHVAGGHGHTGMRERVALYHGGFLAGAVPDGGYAVQATLTLDGRS